MASNGAVGLGKVRSISMTQVASKPAVSMARDSAWTCSRCWRTAFVRDGEGLVRCINCGLPRHYAVCTDCRNGYQAHTPHGCEGISDDGNPCECQRRVS